MPEEEERGGLVLCACSDKRVLDDENGNKALLGVLESKIGDNKSDGFVQ